MLNEIEEKVPADHLIEAEAIGYGKTRREVILITEKVAGEKNLLRKDHVSDGWWKRFKERQPKLSLRCGDATAHVRMDSTNKNNLRHTTIFLKKLFKSIISLIILVKSITWMRVVFHLTHIPLILSPREGRKRYVIECLGKRSR